MISLFTTEMNWKSKVNLANNGVQQYCLMKIKTNICIFQLEQWFRWIQQPAYAKRCWNTRPLSLSVLPIEGLVLKLGKCKKYIIKQQSHIKWYTWTNDSYLSLFFQKSTPIICNIYTININESGRISPSAHFLAFPCLWLIVDFYPNSRAYSMFDMLSEPSRLSSRTSII